MTAPTPERTLDKRWTGYYRAGAISLIIAGILVLITLPLIPLLIPSLAPSSVQSGLTSIQSQSLLFGTTWGIYLVSDLLYLIAFPALYFALRQANRTVTLIAAIFSMVFVAVDGGVDIPLRLPRNLESPRRLQTVQAQLDSYEATVPSIELYTQDVSSTTWSSCPRRMDHLHPLLQRSWRKWLRKTMLSIST